MSEPSPALTEPTPRSGLALAIKEKRNFVENPENQKKPDIPKKTLDIVKYVFAGGEPDAAKDILRRRIFEKITDQSIPLEERQHYQAIRPEAHTLLGVIAASKELATDDPDFTVVENHFREAQRLQPENEINQTILDFTSTSYEEMERRDLELRDSIRTADIESDRQILRIARQYQEAKKKQPISQYLRSTPEYPMLIQYAKDLINSLEQEPGDPILLAKLAQVALIGNRPKYAERCARIAIEEALKNNLVTDPAHPAYKKTMAAADAYAVLGVLAGQQALTKDDPDYALPNFTQMDSYFDEATKIHPAQNTVRLVRNLSLDDIVKRQQEISNKINTGKQLSILELFNKQVLALSIEYQQPQHNLVGEQRTLFDDAQDSLIAYGVERFRIPGRESREMFNDLRQWLQNPTVTEVDPSNRGFRQYLANIFITIPTNERTTLHGEPTQIVDTITRFAIAHHEKFRKISPDRVNDYYRVLLIGYDKLKPLLDQQNTSTEQITPATRQTLRQISENFHMPEKRLQEMFTTMTSLLDTPAIEQDTLYQKKFSRLLGLFEEKLRYEARLNELPHLTKSQLNPEQHKLLDTLTRFVIASPQTFFLLPKIEEPSAGDSLHQVLFPLYEHVMSLREPGFNTTKLYRVPEGLETSTTTISTLIKEEDRDTQDIISASSISLSEKEEQKIGQERLRLLEKQFQMESKEAFPPGQIYLYLYKRPGTDAISIIAGGAIKKQPDTSTLAFETFGIDINDLKPFKYEKGTPRAEITEQLILRLLEGGNEANTLLQLLIARTVSKTINLEFDIKQTTDPEEHIGVKRGFLWDDRELTNLRISVIKTLRQQQAQTTENLSRLDVTEITAAPPTTRVEALRLPKRKGRSRPVQPSRRQAKKAASALDPWEDVRDDLHYGVVDDTLLQKKTRDDKRQELTAGVPGATGN